MSEKIVHIDNVGEVKIKKNKRSKNLSLTIRPQKGITLTLPYFVSYKYGMKFLNDKKEWIEKQLPKIKAIENKKTVFNENTRFKTRSRQLIINKQSADKVTLRISEDYITISYPETASVESAEIQNLISELLIEALRIEAKEYLPKRINELAEILNFRFNNVFIKNNKTLWGSCSGKNNINLNLHLIRLPNHLIDFVIIHELCHTIEKNHGSGFWSLMNSILGDGKKYSKELKQYSTQFY